MTTPARKSAIARSHDQKEFYQKIKGIPLSDHMRMMAIRNHRLNWALQSGEWVTYILTDAGRRALEAGK